MRSAFLILVLLFGVAFGFSQNDFKRDFEIGLQYGNTSVTIDETETVGYFTEANFKKEIAIGKKYSLLTGLSLKDFTVNGNPNQIGVKTVGIPVSVRSYFVNNDKALFAEFGLYGNYLYNSKFYSQLDNSEVKVKDIGYNFGAFFKLGYATTFNEAFKINLALVGGQDFASSAKSNKPEIEIRNQIGIELGIGVNLFK